MSTSFAQTTNSNGTAHLVEFSNANATFKVPLGKTWVIQNAFTSHPIDDNVYYIFIKSLNGITLTNISNNTTGKLLYHNNALANVNLPLYFPENTEFELIIMKKIDGTRSLYNNKAFLNYTEIDN
jgi:hypothetical protein